MYKKIIKIAHLEEKILKNQNINCFWENIKNLKLIGINDWNNFLEKIKKVFDNLNIIDNKENVIFNIVMIKFINIIGKII